MPTLTQQQINTVGEFVHFVEGLSGIRWYRGCGRANHILVPSLYRHPTNTPAESFAAENQILKRFRQRSIPFLKSPLDADDLSVLFLMQHFGVPTRLLDWTESPNMALYFALTSARYEVNAGAIEYPNDAAIWILDPNDWNRRALDFDPPPGIISPPNDDLLNGYLPSETVTHRKAEAVALYGSYNSPRIVAQRGTFTLFGTSPKPMEQAYIDSDYPQDSLIKLVIPANRINVLLAGLDRIGVTDSVAFPDLPGLATEIKREFGYRV